MVNLAYWVAIPAALVPAAIVLHDLKSTLSSLVSLDAPARLTSDFLPASLKNAGLTPDTVLVAGHAPAEDIVTDAYRDDIAIRKALSYGKYGHGRSKYHKGKSYVIDAPNVEAWKDKVFPDVEIAADHIWNLTHEYYGPDGVYRSGFAINGQVPGPSIVANENDWIRIVVNNYLPVPVTIHFHGIDQFYTPWSDGMPGITQYPILSGGSYAYIFQFKNQHGAFWYHAHFRGYDQDGIYGPIHIIANENVERPYSKIPGIGDSDLKLLHELEKRPTNLIVSDSFKRDSDAVLARLYNTKVLPLCVQSILINGKGRVSCISAKDIEIAAKVRGRIFKGTQLTYDTMGCSGGKARTFPESEALEIAGFCTCTPTFTNRDVIFTNRQKYFYFNVYNMASEAGKIFSIDEHDLIVLGVDGMFVEPKITQQLKVPLATRFTVLVKAKEGAHEGDVFSIRFASDEVFQVIEGISYLVYGLAENNTLVYQNMTDSPSERYQDIGGSLVISSHTSLEIDDLVPLGQSYKPSNATADHTVHLLLNKAGELQLSVFYSQIVLNHGMELDTPYLLQTDPARLDFNKIATAINPGVKLGDVVDIVIDNTALLDHPFHMHGHSFSVISKSNTHNFQYDTVAQALAANPSNKTINLETPPFIDTVLVRRNGHAVVRFTAKNPGYWFLHCHVNHHLAMGMGAFIVVDAEKIPKIPLVLYDQPHAEYDSTLEINVSKPLGAED